MKTIILDDEKHTMKQYVRMIQRIVRKNIAGSYRNRTKSHKTGDKHENDYS